MSPDDKIFIRFLFLLKDVQSQFAIPLNTTSTFGEMIALFGFLCLALITQSAGQELFPLSIIHLNDIHARFDETNIYSNTCKEGDFCIGGYARVITKVKELLERRPNPIYLNAGDNFQGTLWYNIHRWNVTSQMLNLLPADAMVNNFQNVILKFLSVNTIVD